jgi:hypothetical protein
MEGEATASEPPTATVTPDLSTFELRWAEALGAPDSDEANQFKIWRAEIDEVLPIPSRMCSVLKRTRK